MIIILLRVNGQSRFLNALTQLFHFQISILLLSIKKISIVLSTSVIVFSISCDSIYEISHGLSKISANFGRSKKLGGLGDKELLPGVGQYNMEDSINPVKNRRKCISFGVSREVKQLDRLEYGVW